MRKTVLLVAVGCVAGWGALGATAAGGAEAKEPCAEMAVGEILERAAPQSLHGVATPVISQTAEVGGRPTCSSITVPQSMVLGAERSGFAARLCKTLQGALAAAGTAGGHGISAVDVDEAAMGRAYPAYRACTTFGEVRGQLVSVVALFTDEPDGALGVRVLVNAW